MLRTFPSDKLRRMPAKFVDQYYGDTDNDVPEHHKDNS